MNQHIITATKAVFSFIILYVLTRFMGRKQLSQFTFFDYIVSITIGDFVAITAVDRNINIYDGIICTVIWAAAPVIIGALNLKYLSLRKITQGEPVVVVKNGVVDDKNMKKARYDIGDLLMQLRQKDVFDLAEVEFALLEPNGELSVLKKPQYNPVTPTDLKIPTKYKGLILELILNGKILVDNLNDSGKTHKWLEGQLKAKNVTDINEVIFAGITPDDQLEIILNNNGKSE